MDQARIECNVVPLPLYSTTEEGPSNSTPVVVVVVAAGAVAIAVVVVKVCRHTAWQLRNVCLELGPKSK